MKYTAVFSIVARHDYYAGGLCPDVGIQAVTGTAGVFRRHRWMTRSSPGRLTVLAEAGTDGKALIEMDPAERLQFRLAVARDRFELFTQLESIGSPMVFIPAAEERGPARTLKPASKPSPEFGPGEIGVEIPRSVLPEVGSGSPEFQIQFKARRLRWKYYCVTDINLSGKEMSIVDRDDSADALRFSPANRTDLNQQPDPHDPLAVQLAQQFPRSTRWRFISDDLVECRQIPRRKLELLLGPNRFPQPLPNPALANCSTVAVTTGDKSSHQPALYQVVTYLTQSLSEKGD